MDICRFLYALFDHVGLIFKNRKLVLGADACYEISAWGGYVEEARHQQLENQRVVIF